MTQQYTHDIYGTVSAVRWYAPGDHPQDRPLNDPSPDPCWQCGSLPKAHGLVLFEDRRIPVCPGDWIVTKADGRLLVMREEKFRREYREAA